MNLAGLMQDRPLLISSIFRYAADYHGDREVIARSCEGPIVRSSYAQVEFRAQHLARALEHLGVKEGDRVATLAWNTLRHYELYVAVSGMGAVLHTINPRLFEEQIAYIAAHGGARLVFVDLDFFALAERLASRIAGIQTIVVLCARSDLPTSSVPNVHAYEDLLDAHSGSYSWPEIDERAASSLCYTSGTTGQPKGVLYSHRSTVLHALAANQPCTYGIAPEDSVLAVVPLYHGNAWALPYIVAMTGAKFVMVGRKHDPANLHELIASELITFSCGVPTVWTTLLEWLKASGNRIDSLRRVIVGGTALPKAIRDAYRDIYGTETVHFWGMTELSPLGTIGTASAKVTSLPAVERDRQLLKQGRVPYGIELQIRDGSGQRTAANGRDFGAIWVRGPWVAAAYFGRAGADQFRDGWFSTGDVGTLDEYGYMQITDRTKDVIKSGGEWISSIAIDDIAMSHPQVRFAATVAAFHPKWDERPLLVIVPSAGSLPSKESVLQHFEGKIAKWWMPDDVVFITEMPMSATGKILKSELRTRYWHYLSGSVSAQSAVDSSR
jgi:acyl-CoA synthetase (AMP-forming)/AMP-acid ligase II